MVPILSEYSQLSFRDPNKAFSTVCGHVWLFLGFLLKGNMKKTKTLGFTERKSFLHATVHHKILSNWFLLLTLCAKRAEINGAEHNQQYSSRSIILSHLPLKCPKIQSAQDNESPPHPL